MMHVDLTETMLLYNTLYRMPEADPQWQLEWRESEWKHRTATLVRCVEGRL